MFDLLGEHVYYFFLINHLLYLQWNMLVNIQTDKMLHCYLLSIFFHDYHKILGYIHFNSMQ